MAAGRIEVELVAKDLITPAVSRLKESIMGSFAGNLAANLVDRGINAALSGIGQMQASIRDAMSLQTQAIGNANNLAGVTGLSFGKASSVIDGLNQKLAEVASSLPGTAQDYVTAANMIAPAFAEGFGKLTATSIPDFQKKLTDLTKNMVLLGQTAQVSSADVAEFSRGFISGTRSFEELRDLNFGTKNPAFLKAVQDELTRQGVETKNFQKMTAQQRESLLLAVSQKMVNPEAVAAMQNSADGMLASVRDGFFDPTRGIFGVLRKITGEGNRSAMDAFTDLLRTSLRLGDTIATLAKEAGLTIDPMAVVIDAVDWLNDILVGIQKGFDLKPELNSLKHIDLSSILKSVTFGMSDLVSNVFTGVNYLAVGRTVGLLIGRGIGAIIKTLLDPQSWYIFIRTLRDGIKALAETVIGLLGGLIEGLFDEAKAALSGVVSSAMSKISDALNFVNPLRTQNSDGSDTLVGKAEKFGGGLLQDPIGTIGGLFSGSKPTTSTPISPLAQPGITNQSSQATNNHNINVAVHAQTQADPQAIANHVMAAISDGYQNFKQTSLG